VIARIEEQRSSQDRVLRRSADRAIAVLASFRQRGLVDIFSDGEENPDANILPLVIEHFRGRYRMCLVMQDRVLATGVLRSSRDEGGAPAGSVLASRIGEDGRRLHLCRPR
jgi:hypothetical protein